MKSKTELLKELVASKQYQKALSLAKTFRRWNSKEDQRAVQLASEIKANSSFYEQIGKDIDAEYQKGVDVLVREYGAI